MEHGMGIRIESRPEYAKILSTNYEILKFSLSYCMQIINSKENAKNDLQTVAHLQPKVLRSSYLVLFIAIFAASNLIHEIRHSRYWRSS